MKILFSFVIGLLFFYPVAVQSEDVVLIPQEEIAEVPALDPIIEAEINDLMGEDPYVGETDWHGKKVTNFNYDKPDKNRE